MEDLAPAEAALRQYDVNLAVRIPVLAGDHAAVGVDHPVVGVGRPLLQLLAVAAAGVDLIDVEPPARVAAALADATAGCHPRLGLLEVLGRHDDYLGFARVR